MKKLCCCILSITLGLNFGSLCCTHAANEVYDTKAEQEESLNSRKSFGDKVKEYIPYVAGVTGMGLVASWLFKHSSSDGTATMAPSQPLPRFNCTGNKACLYEAGTEVIREGFRAASTNGSTSAVFDVCSVESTQEFKSFTTPVRVLDCATLLGLDLVRVEARSLTGCKTAILNMANYYAPGGGFLHGTSSQEEYLCWCTSLYASLLDPSLAADFYGKNVNAVRKDHRNTRTGLKTWVDTLAELNEFFSSARGIYTTNVTRFNVGHGAPDKWHKPPVDVVLELFDVISVAAPKLYGPPRRMVSPVGEDIRSWQRGDGSDAQRAYYRGMCNVWYSVLHQAQEHGVKVLVLGALGCGACGGHPAMVAAALRAVLPLFNGCFHGIVIPVLATNEKGKANYNAFREVFPDAV